MRGEYDVRGGTNRARPVTCPPGVLALVLPETGSQSQGPSLRSKGEGLLPDSSRFISSPCRAFIYSLV